MSSGASIDLEWLAGALAPSGRQLSRVSDLRQLSGGASRQTYAYEGRGADGRDRRYILQVERIADAGVSLGTQARLIRAANERAVPVAPVLGHGELPDGRGWMISPHIDGESIGKRIVNDVGFARARTTLVRDAARALAGIHAVDAPDVEDQLAILDDPLGHLTTELDDLGHPHPAFELGLRWLDERRPDSTRVTPVHGDFRLGNFLVQPLGLAAVLDWELAHRGDPLEDLGWLCVRAWRFGGADPVAGIGTREDLLEEYGAASGHEIDPEHLRWWEIYGTLRWGVICIRQAEVHRLGIHRSVELAAIGRRVCENEYDLLEYLA